MMEKKELKTEYSLWPESYPKGYEDLCLQAVKASEKAYSVYSGFSVGAAVLLENGETVCGSNQENIAYPSGICAERTALFYAGSRWPGIPVRAMALAATAHGMLREEFLPPCGACRQVMAEVIRRTGKDFDVIMVGRKASVVVKAGDLLPFQFDF